MTDTPVNSPALAEDPEWPGNYFNYFTEVEDHFRQARGTGLFLLSPLDWALIENWKNAGIPLEAVLKGIDEAFEKWRSRKVRRRLINSVAYCTQAVLDAAQRVPAGRHSHSAAAQQAPFAVEDVRAHLQAGASALRARSEGTLHEAAASLDALAQEIEDHMHDLEALERRLTALEDKIIAALRSAERDEDLVAIRESLDRELRPYRGRMTADQLAMLERRYLDSALLERAKLPRVSLFYLH